MSGVSNARAASGGGAGIGYTGTVTVGQVTVAGKGFSTIQRGYGTSAQSINGSAFGSIVPTSMSGFPIVGLYSESASPSGTVQTTLAVTGDATALAPTLLVGGVNQNLGAGVLASGVTKFNSGTSQADPFGTTGSTPSILIS